MKTVKRLISVLLILALVASACGCGKDSKTKKNKAKKVSVSVKSLEDAVEAVPKYDEGSYKLSLKINVNDYIGVANIILTGNENVASQSRLKNNVKENTVVEPE